MTRMPFSRLVALALAAGGVLAFAPQAHATCLVRGEVPAPRVAIVLTSPDGKRTIRRKTGTKGVLQLRGLKPGEWQVRKADWPQPVMMLVGTDGKLEIASLASTVSCSAPGGPVNTQTTVQLRQRNRPKTP